MQILTFRAYRQSCHLTISVRFHPRLALFLHLLLHTRLSSSTHLFFDSLVGSWYQAPWAFANLSTLVLDGYSDAYRSNDCVQQDSPNGCYEALLRDVRCVVVANFYN